MKYLVDANVWLEAIVGLPHADEVVEFLQRVPKGLLATTDFVLHSVAIRITPTNPGQYNSFLDDLVTRRVNTLHLAPSHLHGLVRIMGEFRFSFDDAFQYFAADRFDLTIVSYDSDFDRTPRGRRTPAQVLAELTK